MKEDGAKAAWGFRLAVIAGLVAAGFLVPSGWVEGARDHVTRERPAPIDVFDARSRALDAALEAGAPMSAPDRAAARQRRPQLIARRLLSAGPMSGPEVARLVEQVEGWDAELEGQPPASRRALRRHQVKRLVAELPRVDEAAALAAIERFDVSWARAVEAPGAPSR